MRRGRHPGGWPAGGDAGTGTVEVLSSVRRRGQRRNIIRCRGIMVTERGSPRPIHLMPVNLVGGVFVQRFADVRRHLLLVRPRRSGHCREIGVRGSRVLPAHEVGEDHDGKNDQCGNGTPPLHGERKPVAPNDHAHKVVDWILEVTLPRSHSASTQGLPRTPGLPSDADAAMSAPCSGGVARPERPGADACRLGAPQGRGPQILSCSVTRPGCRAGRDAGARRGRGPGRGVPRRGCRRASRRWSGRVVRR